MDFSVDLYAVIAIMVLALAILCLVIRFTVRRHPAMAWLPASLGIGTAQTLLFTYGGADDLTVAIITLTEPITIFALVMAIRLAIRLPLIKRAAALAAVALAAVSLALLAMDVPLSVQAIPFQLASLMLLTKLLFEMRAMTRSRIETGLFYFMLAFTAMIAVRLPFFPALYGQGEAVPSIATPYLQYFTMAVSVVVVPGVVMLLIARIVAAIVGNYRERSRRDALTGLYARDYFPYAVAAHDATSGTLVICDIDHFKTVNDRYGHRVGDEVIRHIACLLDKDGLVAARLGGEEFAIAMPGASMLDAAHLAELIRSRFAQYRHPDLADDHLLSASFGIAPYNARESFEDSLGKADTALYRAKNKGRNQVSLSGFEPVSNAATH